MMMFFFFVAAPDEPTVPAPANPSTQEAMQEPVLLGMAMLGAAMLGAVAGGAYVSIGQTMASMSAGEPTAPRLAEFHRTKRSVHKLLRALDQESREVMRAVDVGASEGLGP